MTHNSTQGVNQTLDKSDDPYIFTTIRWQPELAESAANTAASCSRPCPFYMLEHHWTRLQIAKWSVDLYRNDRPKDSTGDPSQLYHGLNNAVRQWQKSHPSERPEALRIQLRCYLDGRIVTETHFPLERLPMSSLFPASLGRPEDHSDPVWTVVLDTIATEISEATMFKTSNRRPYTRARTAVGLASPAQTREVLLYSPEMSIMDASISTPYFFRNGRWVTPSASSGGLQGTTRRWSLEHRLCTEDVVSADSLTQGEIVWLSNAVRGYNPARYVL